MKNFLILLLVLVFIISGLILFLIINYIDPFVSNKIIIYGFVVSFFLFVSTFFTLIIYFIKKIHYRGQVILNHITSSFRQSCLISLYFIGLVFFANIGVPLYFSGFLLFVLLFFLEMFIQNILS